MGKVWNELWDRAVDRYGYVTSVDAAELGLASTVLGKMASRRRLVRVSFGVYRFPEWPVSGNDSLLEAVLWTRDSEAVLSHDTALSVWELCDVNPSRIHVSVPKQRPLRRAQVPAAYVLHREDLEPGIRGWWEQIPTVTPEVAIRQAIGDGLRPSLIDQAIETALRRSLIDDSRAALIRRDMEERFR